MDVIFPDVGLVQILLNAVGDGLTYHLFDNDVSPSLEDTLATYHQANWSGYAPQTVVQSDFFISEVVAHLGGIEAGPLNFLNTSPANVTVYGYYVTDVTTGTLVAAARFDLAPITIPVGGGYAITPQLGDFSGLTS